MDKIVAPKRAVYFAYLCSKTTNGGAKEIWFAIWRKIGSSHVGLNIHKLCWVQAWWIAPCTPCSMLISSGVPSLLEGMDKLVRWRQSQMWTAQRTAIDEGMWWIKAQRVKQEWLWSWVSSQIYWARSVTRLISLNLFFISDSKNIGYVLAKWSSNDDA